MIILGQTNDDKGTQLEILTKYILSDLGYVNIVRNPIGSGGSEVDVVAEYLIPLPGSASLTRKIICECKAHKDPINLTDWLKFLGKIHYEEVDRNEEVSGCFITLSGVNGPVSGNWETYNNRKKDKLVIINESGITDALSKRHPICSIEVATSILHQYTKRTTKSLEIAYYENEVFWIITFDQESYSILDASGQPLVGDKLQSIIPLVKFVTPLKTYIDLFAELEAQKAVIVLEKQILCMLVAHNGTVPIDVSVENGTAHSPTPVTSMAYNDIYHILTSLQKRGWIVASSENQHISLRMDDEGRCLDMPELIRFMLTGPMFKELLHHFFATPFYDRQIDQKLIEEIQHIQGDLPLSEDESSRLIQLLMLSPTALVNCLIPIELIVNHRNEEFPIEQLNGLDVRILFNSVYDWLLHDLKRPEFSGYFLKQRGIREVETQRNILIKSQEKIVIEGKQSSKQRFIILDGSIGGICFPVMMIDEDTEPWSSPDFDQATIDAAYIKQYGNPTW